MTERPRTVIPGLGAFVAWFARGAKWYGAEWYITSAGAIILFIVVAVTVLAPKIAPYDPTDFVAEPFIAPCAQHLMGTDKLGRDIFSRVVYGSQTIMIVAMLSAILSSMVGVPVGLLSGFAGGKLDRAVSLVMDSIYSFPGLILAIAMAAMLGPGVLNISIAIAVIYIPTYFRMVRGQVLSVREELYVEAAESLGATSGTILRRYVFPNVIPSVVVVFSLNISDAILTEAGLSFIGLGVPPPTPDWGFDLNAGRPYLPGGRWWLITFPGLMIAVVALGFSLLGEGLNEILNPRLREA